jgi:aminoglycoside phosphotransferase (APT) family kinase protein
MPPPRRDLELTRTQLQTWLAGKRPQASGLRIPGVSGPASTGFSSDTLLFDAEWREADTPRRERLVARLKPTGFTVFPTYDIALQYRVLRSLGRTDVPVPRVRWLEEDEAVLGVPFYVMEHVEGRVPTDNPPYHAGGWIPELTPAEREALWWSGIEAMARVHRVDWQALDLSVLDQPAHGPTPLAQQLHEYDAFVSWGMERTRYPLIARAQRWLHAQRPADEPVALCWGDARLGNQIFDGPHCVAVLDWEMVRLGDPVQDLAWWLALDRCFSEGLGIERLAGFPDRQATIARWEQRVGRTARHFGYYEVLALYKFTAIMVRVILQMKHYEVMPSDIDMDENNLASVTLQRVLDEVGG